MTNAQSQQNRETYDYKNKKKGRSNQCQTPGVKFKSQVLKSSNFDE